MKIGFHAIYVMIISTQSAMTRERFPQIIIMIIIIIIVIIIIIIIIIIVIIIIIIIILFPINKNVIQKQ